MPCCILEVVFCRLCFGGCILRGCILEVVFHRLYIGGYIMELDFFRVVFWRLYFEGLHFRVNVLLFRVCVVVCVSSRSVVLFAYACIRVAF